MITALTTSARLHFPSFISLLNSICIFSIFFFSFLLKHTYMNPKPKKPDLPPSPPKLPVIGNLHQLSTFPHRSLRTLAGKYGPLMLIHFGSMPAVVISSAELAEEVMRTHDPVFASRPPLSMPNKLKYGSDVIFAPYGEYWRQMKKITVVHLLGPKSLQSFDAVREEEVASVVANLKECKGKVINLSEILCTFSFDVICRLVLGKKYCGENRDRVHAMFEEFFKLLCSFPAADLIPWFGWIDRVSGLQARADKSFSDLDRFIQNVLNENDARAKPTGSSGSYVDILLALGKDEKDAEFLGRDSIKALVLDAFGAGTEAVSMVLEWLMTELLRNPKELKKVQDEVIRIGGSKQNIDCKDIDKMTYLKAALKEILRLYPPAPILVPRLTTKSLNLRGYEIPAGTSVIVNAWAIGRDAKYWDVPEEFRPSRFLNSDIDFRGRHFQLIPFGAGRRGCPGNSFSARTIEFCMANLLYHFNWEIPNEVKAGSLDMEEALGITARKRTALLVAPKPRFP